MIEQALSRFRTLQQRHYTWGLSHDVILKPEFRCVRDSLTRILGSISILTELASEEVLVELRRLTEQFKAEGSVIKIGLHFSFLKRYGEHVDPAAWAKETPPTEWGERWQVEKELYLRSLAECYSILGAENIGMVAHDDEQKGCIVKKSNEEGFEEWNAALAAKLNFARDVAEGFFPLALFVRYRQGWSSAYLPKGLRGEGTNTTLYEPNLLEKTLTDIRGARQTRSERTGHRSYWLMLNAAQTGGEWHPIMGYSTGNTMAIAQMLNPSETVIFKNRVIPADSIGTLQHLSAYIQGTYSR